LIGRSAGARLIMNISSYSASQPKFHCTYLPHKLYIWGGGAKTTHKIERYWHILPSLMI
jgi:hypothetical protein